MIARVAALLCLLVLAATAAAPASALAQAFDPLPPAPPPQPETQAPANPVNDDEDGLSSTQQLLIAVSGIGLVGGIAWLILRDARSAAPADARPGRGDEPQRKGSQTPAGVRHKQSRAKAKAARQARKKARRR